MTINKAQLTETQLTETDVITKFTLSVVKAAGWDDITQNRQEVKLCDVQQTQLHLADAMVEKALN